MMGCVPAVMATRPCYGGACPSHNGICHCHNRPRHDRVPHVPAENCFMQQKQDVPITVNQRIERACEPGVDYGGSWAHGGRSRQDNGGYGDMGSHRGDTEEVDGDRKGCRGT